MNRSVADALQVEKKLGDLAWENRSEFQRPQNVVERRDARWQESVTSCHIFCDEFAELTEFDQCRRRVVKEIAFGKRAKARETLVLRGEKAEVAGDPNSAKLYAFS
jgi:hypothetical protein